MPSCNTVQLLYSCVSMLTGSVDTFSNSTTLPPLSPVAKYEPSASNSTAEMTSAAQQVAIQGS
jgi:hypothetical protein